MTADDRVATMLRMADQSWEFGRLREAYGRYKSVLAADPASWRARFQVAWIEAAFAPVAASVIADLRRWTLPVEAAERVDRLAARTGAARFLPGSLADWAFETLSNNPKAADAAWWEELAEAAMRAEQHSLAHALFQEAAERAPERYFDPPADMGRLPRIIANHLAAIRAVE